YPRTVNAVSDDSPPEGSSVFDDSPPEGSSVSDDSSPEGSSLSQRLLVRRARTSDVPAMKALVDIYSGKILLEKNLVTLYEAVHEVWIAELDGGLIRWCAAHVE